MARIIYLFILFYCLVSVAANAQPAEYKMTREEYIENYKDEAVKEMLANGIPASITLAQAILESSDGNSPLARYANNHFGIKCKSNWTGLSFYQDDDEKNECFRKYYNVHDSYKDHSEFLKSRTWYASLFELKTTDYKGWASGLKKAGYATNPKYAELLIKIIEDHRLYEFDKLKEIPSLQQTAYKHTLPEGKPQNIKTSVSIKNNLKCVIVKTGDTPYKVAKTNGLSLLQLYTYNELSKKDVLIPGEVLYLEPKKNKGTEEFHIVVTGETMRSIAQLHGIKLKKLYRRNNMQKGTEPPVGEKLFLRQRKPA